jgi:CheY-like chemotaxis protein
MGPVRAQSNAVAGTPLRLDQAADQLEKEGQDLAKAFTNHIDSIRQAEKERESASNSSLWFYVAVSLGVIIAFRKVAPLFTARFIAPPPSASAPDVVVPTRTADQRSFERLAYTEQAQPWQRATTEKEARSAENEQLEEFFRIVSQELAGLRKSLCELGRAIAPDEQKKVLGQLLIQIRELRSKSNLSGVRPLWQLAGGIEGLIEQLSGPQEGLKSSTLRTLAGAIDLLHSLSVRGIRPDLAVEPTPRLLVVDDDPVSRYAVGFAMKRFLVKPDTATKGEAALGLAEETAYDLIFLDVQMPGMDGFEVCSRIHATALNHSTPIVFVTCQSDFDARTKSSLVGGQDLIAKPFLTSELSLKALSVVLRRRLQSETARRAARNHSSTPLAAHPRPATASKPRPALEPALATAATTAA